MKKEPEQKLTCDEWDSYSRYIALHFRVDSDNVIATHLGIEPRTVRRIKYRSRLCKDKRKCIIDADGYVLWSWLDA